MKFRTGSLAAPTRAAGLAAFAAVTMLALMSGQRAFAQGQVVPGEVIVGYRSNGPSPVAVTDAVNALGRIAETHPALRFNRVLLRPGVTIQAAIARLSQQPGVAWVEPNHIVHVAATPNDPYYPNNPSAGNYQYGPQITQANLAWDIYRPQAQVVIAIVDTGVDYTYSTDPTQPTIHPDLANVLYRDSTGAVVGYNFINNTPLAQDDFGHGTHCAGIAAAEINNGIGIAGIAGWNPGVANSKSFVKVMPVKVLDNTGSGTDTGVANGVQWAADHGAKVISMSLGESQYSSTLDSACQYAWGKGCVVVAAAGNAGSSAQFYPAANANVISVAATDSGDNMAGFSNYGSWVSVAAPGVNIESTYPGGRYAFMSGTSMACPHVAGEAALLMAQNPSLTNTAIANIIHSNVDPFNGGGRSISSGGGRINILRALQAAGAPTSGNAASFVKIDSSTQGNWIGAYGSQGYAVLQYQAALPAYAAVSPSGAATYTWAADTTDVRGLQKPNASDRIAGCWYSFSSFVVDINITDGQTHQVAFYCVDWDSNTRGQSMDVLDASTGALLDSRSLAVGSYASGAYVVWNLSGHVKVRFTNTGQTNTVLSGLFFDPQSGPGNPGGTGNTASFLGRDTATQGTWIGHYGGAGYAVLQYQAVIPAFAQVQQSGIAQYTWNGSTSDVRALQKPDNPADRIAGCWYSFSGFTVDVDLTDGHQHQIALYCLDWDSNSRGESIDVLDATSGAVLDSQTLTPGTFTNGMYVKWNVTGHVRFRVTVQAGANAVLSGLFFD